MPEKDLKDRICNPMAEYALLGMLGICVATAGIKLVQILYSAYRPKDNLPVVLAQTEKAESLHSMVERLYTEQKRRHYNAPAPEKSSFMMDVG